MPLAYRLALLYGAFFLLLGVQLPYWPPFLAGRGFDPAQIGFILGAAQWLKVLVSPLAGALADRLGNRLPPMRGLGAAALLFFLLLLDADGFWGVLAVNALATALAAALMPLGEALTLGAGPEHRLDYGRIRLWGSVAFIFGAIATGKLIEERPSEIILFTAIAASSLLFCATANLPRSAGATRHHGPIRWHRLFGREQILLVTAASLIQGSHSLYYGFATIHWHRLGYSQTVIGALWGEGVLAEIGLFFFGGALLARFGAKPLLILSGAAGCLRWGLTSMAAELPALALLQLLHALTFGAAHLAAMSLLSRSLPPSLAASGQSLYAAMVGGLAPGILMGVSGLLYMRWDAGGFAAMAALAFFGALTAERLRIGGGIPPADPSWAGRKISSRYGV